MLAEAFPDFATGRALRVPLLNPGYNYAGSPDCNRFDVIMKTYEGKRTIDGLLVTVDGKRLDEHYEVKRFTRYGFEWTYEGDSPRQLHWLSYSITWVKEIAPSVCRNVS